MALFLKQQYGEKKGKIRKERRDDHLCGSKVSTKQYYILFRGTFRYVKVQGETVWNEPYQTGFSSCFWGLGIGWVVKEKLGFVCIALERQEEGEERKKNQKQT